MLNEWINIAACTVLRVFCGLASDQDSLSKAVPLGFIF